MALYRPKNDVAVISESPYVQSLESDPLLERWELFRDFPHVYDDDVKKKIGYIGSPFGKGIRHRFYWNETSQMVTGIVFFELTCEGPKKSAHGGSIATLLDNLLAHQAMRMLGWGCVTISLTVQYHRFVPLATLLKCESKTVSQSAKKAFVEGRIISLDGDMVLASATALFSQSGSKKTLLSYREAVDRFGRRSQLTKEEFIGLSKAAEEQLAKKNGTTSSSSSYSSSSPPTTTTTYSSSPPSFSKSTDFSPSDSSSSSFSSSSESPVAVFFRAKM